MASEREEEEANSTLKQIYVGNLDKRVSDVLLYRIFSLWGPIELCKVIHHSRDHLSLGYGFVSYYDHKDAQTAMAAAAGCKVYDREMRIKWAHSESSRTGAAKNTLFVGDLGVGVTDLMLSEAFGKFGPMVEARVVRNPATGKSKGYGFVSYVQRAHADQAVANMHGTLFGPKNIRVSIAVQAEELRPSLGTDDPSSGTGAAGNKSVYLGNLHSSSDTAMLRALCSPFGEIADLRYSPGNTFAFVTYRTTEAAAKAIAMLGGRRVNDRTLKASWGKSRDPPPPPLPPPQTHSFASSSSSSSSTQAYDGAPAYSYPPSHAPLFASHPAPPEALQIHPSRQIAFATPAPAYQPPPPPPPAFDNRNKRDRYR